MFTYTVRSADDASNTFSVVADSRDVMKWEKARNGRSVSKLLAEPTVVDSYVLAYLAAKRLELIDCAPAEFEQNYILIFGSEPSPDPTNPAP
jgi:hypothetical protein